MRIFSKFFGGKTIDKMSIDELRIVEIKLNNKIESLQSEIKQIEKEIQILFEKARATTSRAEEISIARRIKTLSQKKDMKMKAQAQLEKELRAITNLIILKEHEEDLKSAGVWDKVRKMDPEKLEKWLVSRKLEAEDRDAMITSIVEMTSSAMESGIEYEEDLEDILSTIRAVKEGEITSEEAGKELEKRKSYEF